MTEAESFLTRWHARHTGTSAAVFGAATDGDGWTSYQRLAAVVPDGVDLLDLACGDGMLLASVASCAPRVRLTGLDLTPEEVAAAQRRIPGARIVLGRAQSLPFADASFDVVTCHMALMLMDDLDAVVAEVGRVLRPGGVFAGTVGVRGRPRWADAVRRSLLDLHRRLGTPSGPSLGDARSRDASGLAGVLAAFEGFAHVELAVEAEVPRAELWPFLREAYYGHDALPEEEAIGLLAGLDLPDPVRWPFDLLQFGARRRGGAR